MQKRYFIMVVMLGVLFVPFFVFSAGLVPCGGPTEPPCTLCHLYVLGQTIIDKLMWTIAPVIATFAIAWGGFNILISGASPGQRNKGIDTIKKTLVGLLIIFSAWIIINELLLFFAGASTTAGIGGVLKNPWNSVICVSAVAPAPGAAVMGPAYDGPGAPGVQAQPRTDLLAAGIDAKTNYCSDFDTPFDPNFTRCTTLAELPQTAISGLIAIKNACSTCVPLVTGGTERLGHTNHGPGVAAVDVAMNASLSAYIYTQIPGGVAGCTIQGVYQLCSANGINYLNEINHWHIHWL